MGNGMGLEMNGLEICGDFLFVYLLIPASVADART
jgi:hypothetical protein